MYKGFKFDDFIRIYSNMMVSSGEITPELRTEIENRWGIDFFKRILKIRKEHSAEFSRIREQVHSLATPPADYETATRLITTKVMSASDLNILVRTLFDEQKADQSDKSITKFTYIRSFLGMMIGAIAGALFWWGILYIFKQPFIYILPVVFMIGYLIIKVLTKQSIKNRVVFVASSLSAALSIAGGHFLYVEFNL